MELPFHEAFPPAKGADLLIGRLFFPMKRIFLRKAHFPREWIQLPSIDLFSVNCHLVPANGPSILAKETCPPNGLGFPHERPSCPQRSIFFSPKAYLRPDPRGSGKPSAPPCVQRSLRRDSCSASLATRGPSAASRISGC